MYNKLNVVGNIPAHTECPYKAKCELVDSCQHQGVEANVEYSCAAARLHETMDNIERSKNSS
jgi:hypothetical protein